MNADAGSNEQTRRENGIGPAPRPPLRRSRRDRVIGGVCGGLGAWSGIESIWLRLAFVVLTIAGGSGVLLYIIAWIAIPEASGDEDEDMESAAVHSPAAGVLIGGGLIALGVVLLLQRVLPWLGDLVWPALLVIIGIAVLASARR